MSAKLTQRERERLDIINDAFLGKLTNERAATMLGISPRQIKRLKKKLREEGPAAIIHRLKGRKSNHHIDDRVKEKTLNIINERYADFRPTFATEKLAENHGITISYGTTRLWMIEEGLWKPRKQKQPAYRAWASQKGLLRRVTAV